MTRNKIAIAGLSVLAGVGVAAWMLFHSTSVLPIGPEKGMSGETSDNPAKSVGAANEGTGPRAGKTIPEAEKPESTDQDESVEPTLTPEEKAEAAAEAKVEAFDNLTDKWMEPSKQGVSLKDIEGFTAAFRAVPKDRKDECIHRALNLIPDENVMLLAGVLMDKTEEKEIVETVFNDVLNRDDDVKKPILKQIFADKTHPCWADTAWILDVTGELPARK